MRITAKGQVTIPAHIRAKSGLLPNTEVDFIHDRSGVRIVKARGGRKPSRGEQLVRRLQGSAQIKMTTDEIMALMRGR
jgi:AbrB family looped-hinge helix DNA binding protein